MIRDTIQSVDPEVPLFDVKTMEQRMGDQFARPQFYKTAVTCFAAFAAARHPRNLWHGYLLERPKDA